MIAHPVTENGRGGGVRDGGTWTVLCLCEQNVCLGHNGHLEGRWELRTKHREQTATSYTPELNGGCVCDNTNTQREIDYKEYCTYQEVMFV